MSSRVFSRSKGDPVLRLKLSITKLSDLKQWATNKVNTNDIKHTVCPLSVTGLLLIPRAVFDFLSGFCSIYSFFFCVILYFRITLNTLTLNVKSDKVYTRHGVPISVTGIAQVCFRTNLRSLMLTYKIQHQQQMYSFHI